MGVAFLHFAETQIPEIFEIPIHDLFSACLLKL
jgi:hypothetical protein